MEGHEPCKKTLEFNMWLRWPALPFHKVWLGSTLVIAWRESWGRQPRDSINFSKPCHLFICSWQVRWCASILNPNHPIMKAYNHTRSWLTWLLAQERLLTYSVALCQQSRHLDWQTFGDMRRKLGCALSQWRERNRERKRERERERERETFANQTPLKENDWLLVPQTHKMAKMDSAANPLQNVMQLQDADLTVFDFQVAFHYSIPPLVRATYVASSWANVMRVEDTGAIRLACPVEVSQIWSQCFIPLLLMFLFFVAIHVAQFWAHGMHMDNYHVLRWNIGDESPSRLTQRHFENRSQPSWDQTTHT